MVAITRSTERAELERQILLDAGFERDPNRPVWTLTTFRGDKFFVTERSIITRTGRLPVRWEQA